jgi:hypothetical protein
MIEATAGVSANQEGPQMANGIMIRESTGHALFRFCYFFTSRRLRHCLTLFSARLGLRNEASNIFLGVVGVHRNWRVGSPGLQYGRVSD